MSETILVFDLGGTQLRAGLFCAAKQRLIAQVRASSDVVRGDGDYLPRLKTALVDLAAALDGPAPNAVSMAVPGPVHGGVVERLPSLLGPSYQGGLDFVALGQELWPGLPVVACNDLTAAGHRYVARGHQDFGVLTLGSGVGGKLFINGRPLLGVAGYGGEIGHWRVPGAPPIRCDCGGVGHLSALASGRGVLRLTQWTAEQDPSGFAASRVTRATGPNPGDLTAEAITAAFHGGDPWVTSVMEVAAQALGAGIAVCALAAGLDLFFLTGGFAVGAGEAFRRRVCIAAGEHAWGMDQDWGAMVRLAEAGEEPGLDGAGFYALAHIRRTKSPQGK